MPDPAEENNEGIARKKNFHLRPGRGRLVFFNLFRIQNGKFKLKR